MKLNIPPVKKTIKSLPGPTVFSNVFPKTNRKSMLPIKCKTFAWTNRAATSVNTLPFWRLAKLTTRLCSANIGGCCQAQTLATMQANMSSEVILKKVSAGFWILPHLCTEKKNETIISKLRSCRGVSEVPLKKSKRWQQLKSNSNPPLSPLF
jgi:hypothetical protein